MVRASSTHGGRREIHVVFWWDSRKERDNYGDMYVDGKIILRQF
jgi:hypothetical protein